MTEGEFIAGKKNGYCRTMDGVANHVSFGNYVDDIAEGKWANYVVHHPTNHFQSHSVDNDFDPKMGLFVNGECVKLHIFSEIEDPAIE